MKFSRLRLVALGTLLLCAWAQATLLAAGASNPLEFQTFLPDTCGADFTVRAVLKPGPRRLGDQDRKIPGSEARLAFHWQPDSSGYAAAFTRKGIRLLKVTQGRIKSLTSWEDWPVEPREELSVAVQRRGPVMRVIVGHVVAAVASDSQFTAGKVGFGASRPEVSWHSTRYQRIGSLAFGDDFMRAEGQQDPWETVAGQWALQGVRGEPGVPSAAITANPFTYRGLTDDKGPALCTTGYWFWDGYRFTAAVKPEAGGEVGLCAYYQSPVDYLLFRWSEGLVKGKRQLVAVLNGAEKVLAESPGGHEPGQWYWLELRVSGERVEAFVDRELACRAKTNALGQGACGLYVAGKAMQAQFDDVTIGPFAANEPPAPLPQSNVIREHFVKDQFLKLWAEESGAWVRAPGEAFWHRGDFYGDTTLTLTLPPPAAPEAKLWAVIAAEHRDPQTGYRLDVAASRNTVRWSLQRKGTVVKSAQTKWKPDPPQADLATSATTLTLEKSDLRVTARLGDEIVLMYQDFAPVRGRDVGYGVSQWPVAPSKAAARCANVMDYTFSSAPVQWRVQRGLWETEPHWACTGRGAHFFGMDIGPAVLWSKEQFRGDLTLEAYVTNAEIPAHVLQTPRHLNFAICGDGANLSSGYSFSLGGSDGKEVRMFRQGEPVARIPFETWRKSAHNQDIWFQVLIQKAGHRVRFWVDGQLAAQYDDPRPLDEGRIGVWTYRTGIVLGRLRIWYDRLGRWQPLPSPVMSLARVLEAPSARLLTRPKPPAGLEPAADAPIVNDFEADFGTFTTRDLPDAAILMIESSTRAKGRRSLKVINRTCGGHFSVWAVGQPFDAEKLPILSFDYRVPKDVKVNLYARMGKRWEEIIFTGPRPATPPPGSPIPLAQPPSPAPAAPAQTTAKPPPGPLGTFAGIRSDDLWRHATFDLLAALKKRANSPTVIDALAFASPDDPFLRCGLTGNPYGAAFYIDNFRVGK